MRRDNIRQTRVAFALATLTLAADIGFVGLIATSTRGPSLAAEVGALRLTISQDRMSVMLGWDAVENIHVQGYRVSSGTRSAVYDREIDVGLVMQTTVNLPTSTETTPYFFAVRAYNEAGTLSDYSNEVTTGSVSPPPPPPPPPDDPCLPPFGNRVVTATITRYVKTTGAAGSLSRLEYLTTSPNAPITKASVLIDGAPARSIEGTDVTAVSGLWFALPTVPGSYTVTLEAVNAAGCRAVQTKDASGKAIVVVVK